MNYCVTIAQLLRLFPWPLLLWPQYPSYKVGHHPGVLETGSAKTGVRNRCPYRRCGGRYWNSVSAFLLDSLQWWVTWGWVYSLFLEASRQSILNFRIGFLSWIGGRLPNPCLPTPFPILGLPPSASASVFYRCFFRNFKLPKAVPRESLHKTLINTVFCVQLSQIKFPHAYALLLHPASATKLALEATWKMSSFCITFFKRKKVASHRSGKKPLR